MATRFDKKSDQIAAFLISEHAAGRIPVAREVAIRFGCSRVYVHQIRGELVRAGKLPVSPRGRGGVPDHLKLVRSEKRKKALSEIAATDAVRAAQEAALLKLRQEPITQVLENLNAGAKPMSTDEKRAFLSELARLTLREEIKVQAISALNRLDSTLRVEDNLGPREPLSAAEAQARINDLIQASRDVFGVETGA